MSIRVRDGSGKRRFLRVTAEGAVSTVVHPHPPRSADDLTIVRPFQAYFLDSSGASDMRTSTASLAAPETWSITSNPDRDVYVKRVSFVIADQNAALNQFGAITALTNGCVFEWQYDGEQIITIADNLTSNFEFVRLCGGNPAIGTTTNSFRASNVVSSSEGYIPQLDFYQTFGMPWGVRIRAGSTDRLSLVVRDATNGVDQFDAVAYGIQLEPE